MLLVRFWTLLPTLTVVFTLYFFVLLQDDSLNYLKEGDFVEGTSSAPVKKIVAFSLSKQVEEDQERIFCEDTSGVLKENASFVHKNGVWTQITKTKLLVYSAHLDGRLEPNYYVRFIGVIRGTTAKPSLYCQTSFEGTQFVTRAVIKKIWSEEWDRGDEFEYFNPVLVSCWVPFGDAGGVVVLTSKPCKVSQFDHRFNVGFSGDSKKNFTVCVKPLNFFEDVSLSLVQWIEMNRILGANRIEFYVETVRESVWEVLKWYQKNFEGFVGIRKFKTVENSSVQAGLKFKVWQKRRYELVTYNDCLYRNLASSWVVPLDLDEIIVPRLKDTWYDLLMDLKDVRTQYASFTVQNAYYLRIFQKKQSTNKKEAVFFFRDTIRSALSVPGESGKSFIATGNALTVFNHYALDVLRPGTIKNYFLPSQSVQMNHYKRTCFAVILPECVKYLSSPVRILDTVMLKYKTVFQKNYHRILDQLFAKTNWSSVRLNKFQF